MNSAYRSLHTPDDPETFAPGILAGSQIGAARERGLLDIAPFSADMMRAAGHDLRIGDRAWLTGRGGAIDLERTLFLTIEPGTAAVLEVRERIELAPEMAGRVVPIACLMGRGLIPSAAPRIEPGFRGRPMVCLFNAGARPAAVRRLDPCVTIEFILLAHPSGRDPGDAARRGGAPRDDGPDIAWSAAEPSLADMLRALAEAREEIRRFAALGKEVVERLARDGPPAAPAHGHADAAAATPQADRVGAVRLVAPIDTLAPAPVAIARPIMAAVERRGAEYVARFAEADIEISGATPEDAVANLRSLILETYDDLTGGPPDAPGSRQRARLDALREFIVDGAAVSAAG